MTSCWFAVLLLFIMIDGLAATRTCCQTPRKKYYFSKTLVNNVDAHKICVKYNLQMASIKSESEQKSFEEGLEQEGIANDANGRTWIAAKVLADRPVMWSWKFEELTMHEPMNYTNWYQGFPSKPIIDECVFASVKAFSFKWANGGCEKEYYVACE